jgi:2-polyprenyl-3-methyl-5-hydroxy-6-metoxy-1,4-benzoquinol methylase
MQASAFLAGEGDAYYRRNRDQLGKRPVVWPLEILERNAVTPRRVLDVGCSDGWLLRALHERHGFVHRGTLTEAGFKFDQYLDVAYYERAL